VSYCFPGDLEDEGIGITDTDRINDSIAKAGALIDLLTGQWFELRTKTFIYDGGQKIYFLPLFCNEITSLKVDSKELTTGFYLYNRFNPDDRENPKIKFDSKVTAGNMILSISGQFGYVEEDETTPLQIKQICTKLAIGYIGKMEDLGEGYGDIVNRGRIKKEVTDGHSYDLDSMLANGSMGALTGDTEIDTILTQYRKPIDIEVA